MTRSLAFLALLTATIPALAQDRHFIYLQTDNEQAFYLKVSGETRSSTSFGYLILPRLSDSSIEFVVGFPQNRFPEYSFRLAGIDRDRGYALKDFGAKGWGLFDMQSMEVSMGKPASKGSPLAKPVPIVAVRDSFASILAAVVGDSAVLDASLIVKKSELEPKPTISAATRADSAMAPPPASTAGQWRGVDSARANAVLADRRPPAQSPPGRVDSAVAATQAGPAKLPIQPGLSKGNVDSMATIRMTLPEAPTVGVGTVGKGAMPAPVPKPSVKSLGVDTAARIPGGKPTSVDATDTVGVRGAPSSVTAPRSAFVADTKKLLEFSDSSGWQIVFSDRNLAGGLDTVSVWIPSIVGVPPSIGGDGLSRPDRIDCQGKVSVSELGQLRRRMEAIPDEDAKVATALREFRLRCYTTEQVRSLLVVFFREEGRFKLLDVAYPRIFDPQAFLSLESVLKDPYFIHRFRKLVGLQ
jgi:hypothetical protein